MTNVELDGLPVNLDDLLNARSIESNRIEFKAGWDDQIKASTVRTICAFANDLLNLGGGYVVLGVREEGGRAILPPIGLGTLDLDRVQKEIRGVCKRIEPDYLPLVFPVQYEGVPLFVIWAPGGDTRPYQAPENLKVSGSPLQFWIRRSSETIKAQGEDLRQLVALTARVPFDDRRNLEARIEDLSPSLVRQFLNQIESDLVNHDPPIDDRQIFRMMNLVVRVNAHEVPRNIGLMFFNNDPDRFFAGTRTEVVQFGDDAGGDLIEERIFRGPIPQQIVSVLNYLNSLGGTLLQKVSGQAEVERSVAYPSGAVEEALVNAFYHRGYDDPPEPVKVYLYPDRMEVISYPGPVPGIQRSYFQAGGSLPPVPARNRRIGDFLKELQLAEKRGSGIPKIQRQMRQNGSPEARFDFDETRTYFRTILPVHPRYLVLHALREAGYLWATGEKESALEHLERSFDRLPDSAALTTQIIEYALALNDYSRAERTLDRYETAGGESIDPILTLVRYVTTRGSLEEAESFLAKFQVLPGDTGPKSPRRAIRETIEDAILKKRERDFAGAHHLFTDASSKRPHDPSLIYELADTKIELARRLRAEEDPAIKIRLYREASDLLRRTLQLAEDPKRQAWYWFGLARALDGLGAPKREIQSAFENALALVPGETAFRDAYESWQKRALRNNPPSSV
ncbi:MAG: putative DNA binding domain-containing protein [Acidobacteria bacterium]|nr:putative DNA binding domain-containing protein [Acidobacteriota bacterium]